MPPAVSYATDRPNSSDIYLKLLVTLGKSQETAARTAQVLERLSNDQSLVVELMKERFDTGHDLGDIACTSKSIGMGQKTHGNIQTAYTNRRLR